MLKIYRWCGVVGLGGVVVAQEILVSAPGPLVLRLRVSG